MTSKPETRLVKKVREEITRLFPDAYHIKIHGGPYQESGISDVLACIESLFFGIEMKMPGEQPTPKQLEHIERVRKAGGSADAFDNIPDVINFIKKRLLTTENRSDIMSVYKNLKEEPTMAKADKKDKKIEEKSKKVKAKAQEVEEDEEDEDLDIEDLDLEDIEEDEEEDEGTDYSEMSLKELKALCKDRDIEFDKKATKEDLIALLEDEDSDDEDSDDSDEDEEDEDEEEETPPAKPSKKAGKEPAKPDKAPAKKDEGKKDKTAGGKMPMFADIPEGHLSTTDVAEMCGIDVRKLRAVLRKEFYTDNGSKRYHWAPGSKELNEILAYFGVAPKKEDKKSKKK